jgi:CRP/FNR family cyclic AMP-dependent transcriptional regulator
MNDAAKFPGTSIFSSLDAQDLRQLESQAEMRHFKASQWIIHYGDVWPFFFFINSGEISAVKESFEGRSLILTTLHTGDIFWGLAFFLEGAGMPASLRAVQDTKLMLWSHKELGPLFLKNGRLAWELSRLVIRRVQLASEMVEKLAFHPVAGRLARLLVDQSKTTEPDALPRDLTLDEMAARIGTTREVVSRFLHRFADDGAITITRTEFSITDHQKLEAMAQKVKG